ncbi:MAG: glycosyltransferase family 87 protein [Ktedonobacterales bacterium]
MGRDVWRHRWELLLATLALLVGAAIWLHANTPWQHVGYDFRDYLAGARDIAAGRNPYAQLVRQVADTTPGDTGFHAHGYVYPPLLGMLLAPLVWAGLSARQIATIWTLVNVGSVVWMGYELNLALRNSRNIVGTLLFAVAALLPAVATYDLSLGQADMLMAALAVMACGLWLRGSRWSWLVLGIAIAIKPTLALLPLVWLWKRDWRAALGTAMAAGALTLGPFMIVGWQALRDYVIFFAHWNAFSANAEYINQSPYGMLLRLFTVNAYTQPLLVASWLVSPLRLAAMAGAALLWLAVVPRRALERRALALGEYLLALPLILFFSPLAEDIHYCLLIPALIGLGWLAWARGLRRSWAAWLLWSAFVFFCIPRIQEIIYPDHLLTLPGQDAPGIGAPITLLRTGALLLVACATMIGGARILWLARRMEQVDAGEGARPSQLPSDMAEKQAPAPTTSL